MTDKGDGDALSELALSGHVVLNGREGRGAAEGEHDGRQRREERLERRTVEVKVWTSVRSVDGALNEDHDQ